IKSLFLKNFKCFNNNKFYCFNFEHNPIILSGPNGFGKTTFFDAVEIALTGTAHRINDIERKSSSLGKHLFLNTTDEHGYIVLNLYDNNQEFSVIVKIDKNHHKLNDIETSFKHKYFNLCMDNDLSIEKGLAVFDGITHENEITQKTFEQQVEYSKKHFNKYYYISQSESLQFLKTKISERKESLEALVDTEKIDNYIDYIQTNFGSSVNEKSKIKTIRENLEKNKKELINELKKLTIMNTEIMNIQYESIFDLNKIEDGFFKIPLWDKKEINSINNLTLETIEKEIFGIHYLVTNMEDFRTKQKNQKLENLSDKKDKITLYIKYYDLFIDNKFDIEKANYIYNEKTELLNILENSEFFRGNLKAYTFKKNTLNILKKIKPDIFTFDIDFLAEMIGKIKQSEEEYSDNDKLLDKILETRNKLQEVHKEIFIPKETCPYCNHKHENSEELLKSFNELTENLGIYKTKALNNLEKSNTELKNYLIREIEYIRKIFPEETNINQTQEDLNNQINDIEKLLNSKLDQESLAEIDLILHGIDWKKMTNMEEQKTFIKNEILKARYIITNEKFPEIYEKYDLNEIFKKYSNNIEHFNVKCADLNFIENKIRYIKFEFNKKNNNDYKVKKEKLMHILKKLEKIEEVTERMRNLKKIYVNIKNSFSNMFLDNLRFPLLFYTGKILQDYQNGLGVFINEKDMRFVSSGESKLDIINTFSSGQLSGFMLSFLFAMNKLYTSKNNNLDFLLIDDPVQTMDDINIASFIELLRNDFSEKQIILSTHETDKENYILYKFIKYNKRGQSFNIREQLY
ncbi:MAG: AAA family ATPase, partial [Fusobacteriales bacterium]|nr:AAA family ATPase [Fusobacteriales bacterium]